MKILLVSFPVYSRLSAKEREFRINVISNVLNETSADFVMFSEHVLKRLSRNLVGVSINHR